MTLIIKCSLLLRIGNISQVMYRKNNTCILKMRKTFHQKFTEIVDGKTKNNHLLIFHIPKLINAHNGIFIYKFHKYFY